MLCSHSHIYNKKAQIHDKIIEKDFFLLEQGKERTDYPNLLALLFFLNFSYIVDLE